MNRPTPMWMLVGLSAACVFPDVDVNKTSSSSGGATGATTAQSSNGNGTGTGSTTQQSSASSTGGAGGAVAMCREPCTNGSCNKICANGDDCDCDGDNYKSSDPACASHPGVGVDCYDCNAEAKPGQANFYSDDRGDGDFDYDCNNAEDADLSIACVGTDILSCAGWHAFSPNPGCGNMGKKYPCKGALGSCMVDTAQAYAMVPQSCH